MLVASSALTAAAVDVAHLLPRHPHLAWFLVWRREDEGSGALRDVIRAAREVSRRQGWTDRLTHGGEPWPDARPASKRSARSTLDRSVLGVSSGDHAAARTATASSQMPSA